MLTLIKNITIVVLFINLFGCSYSPKSLKNIYNDLPTIVSSELKDAASFTPEQSAKVDDYAKALIKWHRQRKLPEYAQTFSEASHLVLQEKVPASLIKNFLNIMEDLPHFNQATHLSHKMASVARSLSDSQILQLEQSLKNEEMKEYYEIKNTPLAKDLSETIDEMLSFLGIKLGSQQKEILNVESRKLHDLRLQELEGDKKWDMAFIELLKKERNTPEFFAHFAKLWNNQDSVLVGKDLHLEKQNKRIFTDLLQKLITSLKDDQRQQLSSQLISISNTLSEMANE